MLIEEISTSFRDEYLLFESKTSKFIEYCKTHSNLLNQMITYERDGKLSSGMVVDINDLGNLLVETNNKIIELNSGQVHLTSYK